MSTPAPPPRLHVVFAREAHKAAVIRRGPASYARLSLWDTDTDVIEHGQWLRGRVYESKCDLSPDGSLFIYFALQEHKRSRDLDWRNPHAYSGTFTAISRPPYFTALALWNEAGTWGGGGAFIDNRAVLLNISCRDTHPDHPAAAWLKCVDVVTRDVSNSLYLKGWIADAPTNIKNATWNIDIVLNAHRSNPDGRYMLERHHVREYIDSVMLYTLIDTGAGARTEITGHVAQMDWDQRGRLICAKDGKLWVRNPAEPNADGTLIEDFNGQTFEPIPPPDWAKQW